MRLLVVLTLSAVLIVGTLGATEEEKKSPSDASNIDNSKNAGELSTDSKNAPNSTSDKVTDKPDVTTNETTTVPSENTTRGTNDTYPLPTKPAPTTMPSTTEEPSKKPDMIQVTTTAVPAETTTVHHHGNSSAVALTSLSVVSLCVLSLVVVC